MVTIQIHDFVAGATPPTKGPTCCPTSDQPWAGDPFVVSFSNVQTATSSFVNAAFVPLLKQFSLTAIKAQMRVTDNTTNQPDD